MGMSRVVVDRKDLPPDKTRRREGERLPTTLVGATRLTVAVKMSWSGPCKKFLPHHIIQANPETISSRPSMCWQSDRVQKRGGRTSSLVLGE